MILVFTASHEVYLAHSQVRDFNWVQWAYVTVFIFSFFLRIILFDEIKDYEVDLKINPTRPLARGLIQIKEVKIALLLLILLELIMTWNLGLSPFLIHAMAVGYSLLMYEEFFIGEFLRPHLTTYAVTHTFVCTLLGISTLVSSGAGIELQKSILGFVFMNWFYFNLFEFARKTWSSAEERTGVASYSQIFGLWGSVFLSLSQVGLGVLSFAGLPDSTCSVALGVGVIYCLLSLVFPFRPSPKTASFFRGLTGAYLLIHYLILVLA